MRVFVPLISRLFEYSKILDYEHMSVTDKLFCQSIDDDDRKTYLVPIVSDLMLTQTEVELNLCYVRPFPTPFVDKVTLIKKNEVFFVVV